MNGIYTLRSSVDNGFDSDGQLRHPLRVRITGNIVAVRELFEGCGWSVIPDSTGADDYGYILQVFRE